MVDRFVEKIQIRGPTEDQRTEMDPIRSESPIGVGSGFIAQASAASVNLMLSIPSGYQFQLGYVYAWGGTVGSIIFYDGGSAGSVNTTIFAVLIPSGQSGPGQVELHPWGVYAQSLLLISIGAASTPAIKVGGYMFAISAPD